VPLITVVEEGAARKVQIEVMIFIAILTILGFRTVLTDGMEHVNN
jgi:hypothetical protein